MKNKRIFSVLSLVVIFSMLLTSCGTPTTVAPAVPTAPATGGTKELTIAGVVFQDDQFMKTMVQGYMDAGAKYGIKVMTANTNNDQAKETELIQTYISQGVSGIAIAPLSKDASIVNLKQAADKGIKVAITNMSINDTSFLAGGYTSDDATNGKVVGGEAAKYIKANLTGDIKVARIDFDTQLPDQSKARWSGFYSALDAAGVKYTEVAKTSAWLQDTALAATMDILTANPGINVIFACNDGSTIGAAMAVKQAGLQGKVFVFGYDGGDQQTSMILSGDNILIAVVAQDPYAQGYKAVESLALTLQGKANPDAGKITIVPGMLLSSTNPAGVNAWRTSNGLKEVGAAAPAKEFTVAGIVFQDDQFMKTMVQGYMDAGAKYGIKVMTANTNNDQAKETELIQTYISQGVSGIAIAPLSKDASIVNLKQAADKGIKVAITNMSINDTSFLAGGYTSDDATNGKVVGGEAAKYIKANLTGDIKVARIDFDTQLPDQSKARWSGFYSALDAAGVKYTEVAKTSAWLQDTALAATMDILTANPGINVIFACNDGSTIGAAMAVKQAGLQGKVFVFGYDGGDQQTSMILSGDNILIAVVAQDPYAQGYKAVESLALTLQGKANPDAGKITIVPGMLLSSTNPAGVNAWRTSNGLKEVPVTAPPAANQFTIAGIVFQDDQFMKTMVQGYMDAGAKYGIKVMTANTNNDQAKETELIQTYISQGVSGIAIAPLSKDASIVNLKQAADKGIKVAITNMSINDTSFLAGGYTSDDATNGKVVGGEAVKFIKANLTGDIKIARIDFDTQLPDQSKARWSGFYSALDAGGVKYTEVAKTSAWLQDTALAATMDILTANPGINVIFACNDGSTIGAAMAVKQAGLQGKVFVFGYDGGDQQTSMILSGDNILIAVVAQDPYAQGYKAVESLALTLLGKPNPDAGKITIVPGMLLSSTNPEAVKKWRADNGLK